MKKIASISIATLTVISFGGSVQGQTAGLLPVRVGNRVLPGVGPVPGPYSPYVRTPEGRICLPNGCTRSPDFSFKGCCDSHDVCYCRGGTSIDRRICDQKLRQCIELRGHRQLASVYYHAVRTFGEAYWAGPRYPSLTAPAPAPRYSLGANTRLGPYAPVPPPNRYSLGVDTSLR